MTLAPLEVEVEPDRDVVVVRPVGELDMATLPKLSAQIDELRAVGFTKLRIDLSGLTFIDSCGLHFVVRLSAEKGLEISVVPGPPAVHRAFELAGLAEVIPFARPARRHPAARALDAARLFRARPAS